MKKVMELLYTQVLKDTKVFSKLYSKGQYCASKEIVAYYLPNRLPYSRFAVTASKKIGNAVKRNRAKRIMRELYRGNELKMPIGYDIIFVARPEIDGKKLGDIEFFVKRLLINMSKDAKGPSAKSTNRKVAK